MTPSLRPGPAHHAGATERPPATAPAETRGAAVVPGTASNGGDACRRSSSQRARRGFVDGLSAFAALVAGGLLLASCGGGGGLGGANGTGGSVRLVNATFNFAALDLLESTDVVVSGTALSTSSGYADTDAEAFTFNLRSSSGSSTVAASVSGTIERRKHATVVAYTTGNALNAAFLTDEEGSPGSGTAKLRVFNTASAEAGAVDVYLLGTACSELATLSVAATASNVSTLQTGYAQVSAASGSGTPYHLCVTATGDTSDVRLDLPTFTLADQQIVTLILTRTSGGVLLNGLTLEQQGALQARPNTSARFRVAAGAIASGTVGATVNGVSLGNLGSPDVGGYALIPAGALTTSITINGTAAPFPAAGAASAPTAAAGADLTLLVAGSSTAPELRLLVDDNTPSTSTTKPVKMRLVNGFASPGTVTLSVDGIAVGSGAAFGTASSTAFVASSSQASRLRATGPAGQLYLADNKTLTSGSVYTLFLLGDPPATLPGLDTGILRLDR